jgi:FecR protein
MMMSSTGSRFLYLFFVVFFGASWIGDAQAQQPVGPGCVMDRILLTGRQTLRCEPNVTIVAEGGAQYTLLDRDKNGRVDGANLGSKAILIDAPKARGRAGFQVITPQAIAAVRGTKWAVDVGEGKTSVFVVRGSVAVRRPSAGRGVTLGPGEGVDVDAGTGPLTVKRWPPERAAALLARLGQ